MCRYTAGIISDRLCSFCQHGHQRTELQVLLRAGTAEDSTGREKNPESNG